MELLFPLLILALLVPTFLGVRRQKKEMQKVTQLQESLRIGDRVMTTAGLHATVVTLAEDTVDLEIAPGVVTTWSRIVVRERIGGASADHPDHPGSTPPSSGSPSSGSPSSGSPSSGSPSLGSPSLDKGDDNPPEGRPVEH